MGWTACCEASLTAKKLFIMAAVEMAFETVESGAALMVPCQAGDIKKGMYAMLKREPCKVVEVAISKTGKHGHAKAAFVGIHIFTGKKYEDVFPAAHKLEV